MNNGYIIVGKGNNAHIISVLDTETLAEIERESIDAKLKDKDSNYSLKGQHSMSKKCSSI